MYFQEGARMFNAHQVQISLAAHLVPEDLVHPEDKQKEPSRLTQFSLNL